MKKFTFLFVILLCVTFSFAQVPQGFNLQMVIRDAGGAPIPSEQVQLRYTLLKDSISGTPVYQETQTKTSNQFGLINTIFGEGSVVFGDFSNIKWQNNSFFLKQELDLIDGNGYLNMGVTQLYSVPYSNVSGGLVLHNNNGIGFHVEVDSVGSLYTVPHMAPSSMFNADLLYGPVPVTIQFADSSTNMPTSWLWDFGDNTIATIQNPTHEYTTTGLYTVTLTVTNDYGIDTKIKTDYILILPGCPATCSDIDGNIYNVVRIGNQCWMKENLRTTHYPNGDEIPYITDNSTWGALEDNNIDDAYCYYDNNASNEFHALYTYAAAIADNWQRDNSDGQGICPDGWHLPSDEEWKILEGSVDTQYGIGDPVWSTYGWRGFDLGTHMKSVSGWLENGNGDNSSGFTAIATGRRTSSGSFGAAAYEFRAWTSTEYTEYRAWIRLLNFGYVDIWHGPADKSYGYSVRCLRD